jgi:hypothetical protein
MLNKSALPTMKLIVFISTIFASTLRLWYLYYLTISPDSSWIGFRLFVASATEMYVAVICACAPFLKASFRRFFGAKHKASGNGRNHKSDTKPRRDNALFPSEGLSASTESKLSAPFPDDTLSIDNSPSPQFQNAPPMPGPLNLNPY